MSGELVIWAGHAAVFILLDFLAGVCRKITRISVSLCLVYGYVQKLGGLGAGIVILQICRVRFSGWKVRLLLPQPCPAAMPSSVRGADSAKLQIQQAVPLLLGHLAKEADSRFVALLVSLLGQNL
jgi:hypothetical protein